MEELTQKEPVKKVIANPSELEHKNDTISEEVSKQSVVKDRKAPPKVSMTEVLASKHLSDASKFHVFKELVQEGHMSNKEVVNSVLYLVS